MSCTSLYSLDANLNNNNKKTIIFCKTWSCPQAIHKGATPKVANYYQQRGPECTGRVSKPSMFLLCILFMMCNFTSRHCYSYWGGRAGECCWWYFKHLSLYLADIITIVSLTDVDTELVQLGGLDDDIKVETEVKNTELWPLLISTQLWSIILSRSLIITH